MSLKSFHVVFIAAALVLSTAFGLWGATDYFESGDRGSLLMGILSLVVAAAIIPYSVWFLRKMRKVSFL
jgi:hypothetical protein